MKIAVIPARGGSKRIPRKNIKSFFGRPMIAWTIEAAISTGLFDHVLVSTDDDEIAEMSLKLGAEVPFKRPDNLSDDYTATAPVIAHAIEYYEANGVYPDAVCCIYATAPFIDTKDIISAFVTFDQENWDFCFTATDFPAPVFRAFHEGQGGGVEMFFPENFKTRSQDLPEALHDAGQFYWGKPEAWKEERAIFSESSKAFRIPRWRVQDIDTEDDWVRAEAMADILIGRKQ